jgi:Arc/MetJ-type ribon-helix-helix transcriptional regulator
VRNECCLCYDCNVTITLTPEQQKRLEAAVAAGQFSSVEEAVRWAVDSLVIAGEDDDLSWAKPNLDEAREAIARGETFSLEDFNAHVEKRLSKLR